MFKSWEVKYFCYADFTNPTNIVDFGNYYRDGVCFVRPGMDVLNINVYEYVVKKVFDKVRSSSREARDEVISKIKAINEVPIRECHKEAKRFSIYRKGD